MSISYSVIKDELLRDLQGIFREVQPSYPDMEPGIELFWKVITHRIGAFDLEGQTRKLTESINEAFTNKVGQLGPLDIIKINQEAYFKKLLVLAGIKTRTEVLSRQYYLGNCFSDLSLNARITSRSILLKNQTEGTIQPYKADPEYLYYICSAYLTRNEAHVAPETSRSEVIRKLSDILVVMIYAAFKYRSVIDSLPNLASSPGELIGKISKSERYLYDFIAFGSSANAFRNQILKSFVLNYLKDHGPSQIEVVRSLLNNNFSVALSQEQIAQIANTLSTEKKIYYERSTGELQLLNEEANRIQKVQTDFDFNRGFFLECLHEIAEKYGVGKHEAELFDKLQALFEANFEIDIEEAYDRADQLVKDEHFLTIEFISYLNGITENKEIARPLFKELIELSKTSSFLLQICAGRAFATLTDPDRFQQYLGIEKRTVYLDTQIVLFALLLDYGKNINYENVYYKSTEELFALTRQNQTIKLMFSSAYLGEVVYQLKTALLLIPLEGIVKGKISTNIFYEFYWYLNQNQLLPDKVSSFAAWMLDWFGLKADDAYERNFARIALDILYPVLGDLALNIQVVEVGADERLSDAITMLDDIITGNQSKRSSKGQPNRKRKSLPLVADAKMMCHLCSPEAEYIEPFFLTWDRHFVGFRKAFIDKYDRSSIHTFHLFNPAKFTNHVSLINLKINPQSLATDYLTLVDGFDQHEKAITVWDEVIKLLNNDHLDRKTRSDYSRRIKSIFEADFGYSEDVNANEEISSRIAEPLDKVISAINEHYNNGEEFGMIDYRNLLLSSETFDKMSSLIFGSIKDSRPVEEILKGLDNLIIEMKTDKESE